MQGRTPRRLTTSLKIISQNSQNGALSWTGGLERTPAIRYKMDSGPSRVSNILVASPHWHLFFDLFELLILFCKASPLFVPFSILCSALFACGKLTLHSLQHSARAHSLSRPLSIGTAVTHCSIKGTLNLVFQLYENLLRLFSGSILPTCAVAKEYHCSSAIHANNHIVFSTSIRLEPKIFYFATDPLFG
ncbi:hypothetical protein BGZ60DRAFT_198536 [Tricladium varicosporioides]|nr:hypothetical protein BGZ60DRAFT_198536 [Hymenoscyphus varicosporioides]